APGDKHPATGANQHPGNHGADALGSAGDQCGLARQGKQVRVDVSHALCPWPVGSVDGAKLAQYRDRIPDAAFQDDLAVLVPAHDGHATGLGGLAGGVDAEKLTRVDGFPGPLEGAQAIVANVVEDLEDILGLGDVLVVEAAEKAAQGGQVILDMDFEIDVLELELLGIQRHQLVGVAGKQTNPVLGPFKVHGSALLIVVVVQKDGSTLSDPAQRNDGRAGQ